MTFATFTAAPNVAINPDQVDVIFIDGLGTGYGIFVGITGSTPRAISGTYATLAEAQAGLVALCASIGHVSI